jgi:ABC-2 type transport system permease protein
MNWRHFRAFLWLRWRLRINQIKRAGTANAVLLAILTVLGVILAFCSFFAAFALGVFVLADVSSLTLTLVWDGVAVVFLFVWMIALVTDLQRSEALSLEKFLHLPVTLTGVFLINYLSSLLNLRLILFVPGMVGLSLGLAYARGPALLLSLPLLAAFLLMVTALTNQFQGWLASIMMNKRRRRTVILFLTFGVIMICQVPNLMLNVFRPFKEPPQNTREALTRRQEKMNAVIARQSELLDDLRANRTTMASFLHKNEQLAREGDALRQEQAREQQKNKEIIEQAWQKAELPVRVLNIVLPPGWLPVGVATLAENSLWPSLLGTVGLGFIGSVSLWRSYRTTVRMYTGHFNSGAKKRATATPAPTVRSGRPLLLERRLPWLSEQAAAIALGSFRSLTRAPEAKILFLTAPVMLIIFGSMLTTRTTSVPESIRPLLPFGAMALVLFSMIGFVGNQFGFDRSGFRVFVLCGAPRHDILLGKNLAFAPFALGLGTAMAIVLQSIYPMSVDHFLAIVPQIIAMYLLFCLVANLLSILSPMHIAAGSLRPANPKLLPMLLHIAFVFLFPLALAPMLVPLGIEALLNSLGYLRGVPVCLVLMLAESAIVALLYRVLLVVEGKLLQVREQKILDVVTPKVE